jgi:hypothetical protein
VSPAVDTAVRARPAPSQVADAAGLHGQHQTLMRAYQARYVVLPPSWPAGSILGWLDQRYDPAVLAALEAERPRLEQALIAPQVDAAIADNVSADVAAYAAGLQTRLRSEPETAFTAFLRTAPDREDHYRDFLLQSSADLLAEASASAFGVIGAFGAPQSALFRILIDEFGYGAHARKHSVLYQAIMRDFGLNDTYDAYAPLFDTPSLELHNTIHFLFQNPRNIFLQVGFLLFAETAYQRSTADHFRYLREFHPGADARYFGEHAHIDLHHTRMVIDEVAAPLVASYGAEAGDRIVAGAELTRAAFARAGAHLLAVHRAFAEAVAAGKAAYRAPADFKNAQGLTPQDAARIATKGARIQVGGLGAVSPAAFARFPGGAYGRLLDGEAAA